MPGIDFNAFKSQFVILDVLAAVDWEPSSIKGTQARARCPVHNGTGRRSFSVNLESGAWRCFSCGAQGGKFDLWLQVQGQSEFDGAISLAEKLGINLMRVYRW